MDESRTATTDAPSDDTFTVFAALWALATLFHLGSYAWWSESLLAAVAAVWLLARPSSVYRFVSFSVIQLVDFWAHLPEIPNHWLISASIDLLILLAFVRLALERGSFRVSGGELLEVLAPPARLTVVIVYAYTLVHKLNWDFLAPEVSCAAAFHAAYADAYPLLPDGRYFRLTSIYATLAVEALIPVLLCFRALRGGGVLLGLLFHDLLSVNPISGFYNFSAMMVALYLLFARRDLIPRIVRAWRGSSLSERLRRERERGFAGPGLWWRLLAAAALLLAAGYLFSAFPSRRLFFYLWLPYGAAATVLYAAFEDWRPRGSGGGERDSILGERHDGRGVFKPSHAALLVVPALVFVNGLAPYLGLKTETSFAMYSNLRTEGGRTNHLFIPADTQVFDYQKDLVEVVSSSDRRMQRQAEIDRHITFFELRRHMSERPDESIHYIRRFTSPSGESGTWRKDLPRAGDDPELGSPPPLLLSKLLSFRDVSPGERQRCMH